MKDSFYLFYIILFIVLSSCNIKDRDKFIVIGEIDGLPDSTILVLKNVDDDAVLDTAIVKNNRFTFSGRVMRSMIEVVIRNGDTNWWKSFDRRNYYYKYFYLNNSQIFIKGKINDFYYASVTGGPKINEELMEYLYFKKPLHALMDSLSIISWDYKKNNNSKLPDMIRISKQKAVIKGYKLDLLFIHEHPEFELSASLLFHYARNRNLLIYKISDERIMKLYDRLSPKWKKSHYGKEIINELKNENINVELKDGMKAPDIGVKNVNKKIITLSSLKGKYILLDFWSSGCGPCRFEHENHRKLYERFHSKGFEIFSISLDKNYKNWIKAARKDSLEWINTCNLKGRSDPVFTKYRINYFPKNFLIDPSGYIIAKDLRGEALSKKLEKLFK